MAIISSDPSHHLCCLQLLSPPHMRFPILPSAHSVRLRSPPVQWKSSCQGHQEPSCCQIWPSFLCPPLKPTSAGTDHSLLPQPLDNILSWFSFCLKDQSFLAILSEFSFLCWTYAAGEAQAVLGPSSLSLLSPYVISSNTIQMLMCPKYITLDLTSTYIV